jgi:hypothetical protein
LTLTALIVVALAARGGELFRPVPPDAQVTRFTRFNIRYTLRDIIADDVIRVEFFITRDMGNTWERYGEDPDRVSPMTVQLEGEGVYGFVCVATDRFGNREREPGPRTRPETVIIVDRTPPTAKWLSPLQDVLSKGSPVEFRWEAGDRYLRTSPVRIQYAQNAQSNLDRNANWQDLEINLPPEGSISWFPPANASGRYNFRLVAEDRAGNLGIAYNPSTLIIDTIPPTVTGVQPLRSNQLRVNLSVSAEDDPGGSGVKEISLYSSDNGGADWTLLKERSDTGESVPSRRPPETPLPFEVERSGEFALWPVVFDNAENSSPLPAAGVAGPFILVVDNEPPSVTLSNSFLQGRNAILVNETRVIEWTSYDPHPREGATVVHLSLDNGRTWRQIDSGLSSSGSSVVNFQYGSESNEAMLKVAVEDDFGNVGEGLSQSFRLSSASTVITGVNQVGPGTYGGPNLPPPSIYDPNGAYSPTPTPVPPYGSPPPTVYDPSGAYSPAPTPVPPYGSPPPSVYDPYQFPIDPPVGESTAGSFPSAMLGSSATASSSGVSPPAPARQQQQTQAPAWNPTPPQSSFYPGTDSVGPTSPAVPPGYFEAPADTFASPAMPRIESPVAPPPAIATTQQPTATTPVTPPPAVTDSGSIVAPISPPPPTTPAAPLAPPPGGTTAPAAPQAPSMTDFFSNFGGDLQPPPLPSERPGAAGSRGIGMPPAPSVTPPAISLTPPSGPAPTIPAAPPPTPPVATPAIPTLGSPVESLRPDSGLTPPLSNQPPPIPPMTDEFSGSLSAPPAPSGSALPTDPRQLSNHYADEAGDYLEEGRVDLALEAATNALNTDNANPLAYSRLAQAYVQQDPPNFARAATLAKEATDLGMDWYSWWTCADVFYRWSHARNRMVQTQLRGGQRPSADLLDERNQALNNAQIAVGNAGKLVRPEIEADMEQVALTQGEITYLRALSIPEPIRPPADAPPSTQSEYRSSFSVYKNSVTPILLEALPHFQTAMRLGGAPSYREAFHIGIINFRLGGLEKDAGNAAQSANYYETAARFLEEATTAVKVPAEGPREAYYMLAYSHDQLAEHPGGDSARQRELALRYWRRTADFYAPGSAYRDFAERRIAQLQQELGL